MIKRRVLNALHSANHPELYRKSMNTKNSTEGFEAISSHAVSRDSRVVAAIVSSYDRDARLVREAHWIALEQNAALCVIIVSRNCFTFDNYINHQADRLELLAKSFAADTFRVSAANFYKALEKLFEAQKCDTVIVGQKHLFPWKVGLTNNILVAIRNAAETHKARVISDVQISNTVNHFTWRINKRRPWFHEYINSSVAVILAALLVLGLETFIPIQSLSIIFMTAVIYSAAAYGFAAALFTSIFSVALFDFFFVLPRWDLTITGPSDILMIVVFFIVAGITSNLAGKLRDEAAIAERREAETRALFQLTRDIATASETKDVYRAVVRQCDNIFDTRSILLLPHMQSGGMENLKVVPKFQPENLQVVYPKHSEVQQEDIEVARWAFANKRAAGWGAEAFGGTSVYFQPLQTSDDVIGILGLRGLDEKTIASAEFKRIIGSFCRLAAVAIERASHTQELEDARVLSQTASFRSALLSSISHDFGTPLASIIGSASSLIDYGEKYSPTDTHDLLATIMEEGERLNRFIKNLLQMTRLESGAIMPRMEWADVDDLINTALDASHRRLVHTEVSVDIEERLPLVNVDFVLMETVLVNMLDNAVKYSPSASKIHIKAWRRDSEILVDIIDSGRGIGAEDLGAVFDKFFRVKAKDRKIAGTGLGLAICRGVLESHSGTIEALSDGLNKGTTMRIHLPVREPQIENME